MLAACTSVQEVRAPQLPVAPAPVLDLAHPEGYGVTELKALFLTAGAPERKTLRACAVDFEKLVAKTQLVDELRLGARELVTEDPKAYHWCFYDSLLGLDEGLRRAADLDEKQKMMLSTYRFAIPVARAFQVLFKDSRYLRWAVQRYRTLSPQVFYRRVELTPEATAELAVLENPFGAWKTAPELPSILTKYGIRSEPERAPAGVK